MEVVFSYTIPQGGFSSRKTTENIPKQKKKNKAVTSVWHFTVLTAVTQNRGSLALTHAPDKDRLTLVHIQLSPNLTLRCVYALCCVVVNILKGFSLFSAKFHQFSRPKLIGKASFHRLDAQWKSPRTKGLLPAWRYCLGAPISTKNPSRRSR